MSNICKCPLRPPKVVAIATDKYLKPKIVFEDNVNIKGAPQPRFGQDITFGTSRKPQNGQSVGKNVTDLIPKMEKLLETFASNDKRGMARRLFTLFLSKQSQVIFFDDKSLNVAASMHKNIKKFCSYALSAPNSIHKITGKKRIHKALEEASWDIKKIKILKDLGVPAFNIGSKVFKTDDFENGLGLMINGVQYVYIIANNYFYNEDKNNYCLTLRFVFYDVFGLDDDDLNEYGAESDSDAAIGITAWWQLQHQHGFPPLVTRVIIEKTYEVPTL